MSSATKEQKRLLYEQLIGQRLAGKYTLTGLLGFGGMGAVYAAVQSPMDRRVALKLIPSHDPTAAARFEREAYTVSKLSHPNTVTVFDFGHTEHGQLYLSMEYLQGHTLTELIHKQGPLHPARAVHIAEQICRSLGEAHRAGIMHRDIKPDNILLINVDGDPDYVKVLDFGIAKAIQGEDDVSLTAEGRIVGTPRYMSPEQILGLAVDHRSDLYSLGCILFEMLCGSPPFDQQSTAALMISHAQQLPPHFSDRLKAEQLRRMPPALERAVHRTLEKHPAARPADTEAMRHELLDAVGASPSGAYPRPAGLPAHVSGSHQGVNFEHHTGDFSHQTGNFAHRHVAAAAASSSLATSPSPDQAPVTSADGGRRAPRSKAPWIALALLLLLVAALAAVAVNLDRGESTRAPRTAGAPVTSAQAAKAAEALTPPRALVPDLPLVTSTTIISSPPGARVLRDGQAVGVTPFKVDLERLEEATVYRLELEGHEPKALHVSPDETEPQRVVALSPRAASAQSAPPESEVVTPTPRRKPKVAKRATTPSGELTEAKKKTPPEPDSAAADEDATPSVAPVSVTPKVQKLGLDDPSKPQPKVNKLD